MKAILVFDKPNNCYDCKYCRFDARRYNFRGCILTDTEVQDGTIDIRKEVHSCCPLKPIPKKQEHRKGLCSDFILGFEDGWNDCLNEITGETE